MQLKLNADNIRTLSDTNEALVGELLEAKRQLEIANVTLTVKEEELATVKARVGLCFCS